MVFLLFQISKFMSDMGGAMGMCIGASFVTAMEFVELLADLLVLFCTKSVKTRNSRASVNPHKLGDNEKEKGGANM